MHCDCLPYAVILLLELSCGCAVHSKTCKCMLLESSGPGSLGLWALWRVVSVCSSFTSLVWHVCPQTASSVHATTGMLLCCLHVRTVCVLHCRGRVGRIALNKSLKAFNEVVLAVAAGKKTRAPFSETPLTHLLKVFAIRNLGSLLLEFCHLLWRFTPYSRERRHVQV
jgi:hypothetical protein